MGKKEAFGARSLPAIKNCERMAYTKMKQPYEAPSVEVLYLKVMQDILSVSGGEFEEDDDDIFNN